VPDWDNTDSRERDEDAEWRDLVARFDAPPSTGQPVPWPAREDVPSAPAQNREGDGSRSGDEKLRDEGSHRDGGSHRAQGTRGFDDEGIRSALNPDGLSGAREPDVIQAARHRRRPPPAHSIRPRQAPADQVRADDEHFVPPTPPPLPKLDSITKGAWTALFGGPAYLVVATVAGWSVSGITAFCAVAAFVTGFALLVLRMNEPGPGGPDDGEDGAVV
jgi:hypothetical protein